MGIERIYKVLMATGIAALDDGVKTLEQCNVIATANDRNAIYDKIEENRPQIVITSDWLEGEDSVTELLLDLKRQYNYVRFIYLAGQLDPRDQGRIDELGRLVLSGIYDICISKNVNLEVIDNLIKNPKQEAAVSFLAKNILNSASPAEFVKDDKILSGLSDAGKMIKGTMDNVYVFTSIKPGTGKSFLSVNTACAIAAYGKVKDSGEKPKVALIEADLQTLSIGTILDIKEDKKKNMKSAMEAISTIFDKGNMIGDDNSVMLVNKVIHECMQPYNKIENLHVLTGSTLTPEEIDSLKITPEYYIYLLDIIRKEYDIVIIDTNSSMFHITTYPILQKAYRCYYILNLDINNIRNNLRYYGTLKKLGLVEKIRWILNENIENKKNAKENGTNIEKLEFTADEFEEQYFKLSVKVPSVPKAVFLNRLYNGTPVVLDQGIEYTKEVKLALMELANQVWDVSETLEVEKHAKKGKGLFGGFFSSKPKEEKPKKEKTKKNKKKAEEVKKDE